MCGPAPDRSEGLSAETHRSSDPRRRARSLIRYCIDRAPSEEKVDSMRQLNRDYAHDWLVLDR